MLQADATSAGFDTAFIVSLSGSGKTGFKQVMARQGSEAFREFALKPMQATAADDGGGEIVVDHSCGDTLKMLEGAQVTIKKSELVAALIEPSEIEA